MCRCVTGNLAEFVLTPIYSHRSSIFACHVEPVPRYKVYDVDYAVLYRGVVVNDRRLKALRLYDQRAGHPDKAVDKSAVSFTTTQPSYLHNLVTVQPPRSSRSSSLVTLARQSTSSSLRITDRSFQYASPRLWNQLPASLRQPRISLSNSDSPSSLSGTSSIGSIDSPLSSSITCSLFHSRLKTFLFCKSFPPKHSSFSSGLTPRIPLTVYRYF